VLGNHRADIATDHSVVELQHSFLPTYDIWDREDFYSRNRDMVWLFDVREPYAKRNLLFHWWPDEHSAAYYGSFTNSFVGNVTWMHRKKTFLKARDRIYFDIGASEYVFQLQKHNENHIKWHMEHIGPWHDAWIGRVKATPISFFIKRWLAPHNLSNVRKWG
jgi:hypothetical protein